MIVSDLIEKLERMSGWNDSSEVVFRTELFELELQPESVYRRLTEGKIITIVVTLTPRKEQ